MEQDCLDDALLLAVVEQAQKVRRTLRSLADDPEANWLDGYIAGWFKAYFHPSPLEEMEPIPEEVEHEDIQAIGAM